jgi:hypothetical protein
MAGTITVGELLSDPSSSNKITIGTGTTLDLVSGAGSVIHPAPVGMDDVSGVARATSGLLFNGDTAAANALDDYEEGAWTPQFEFGGASVGIVYLNTNGNYTKIGNKVTLTGYIQISNKGTSTGSAFLTNFPFASGTDNGNGNCTSMTMAAVNISFADHIQTENDPGATSVGFREITSAAGAATAITDANFASNVFIRFSVTYRSA